MASFDQKLRTLRLMEILLDRTDDTHMLNASELCTILDQEYPAAGDNRGTERAVPTNPGYTAEEGEKSWLLYRCQRF